MPAGDCALKQSRKFHRGGPDVRDDKTADRFKASA
jgi:hypothetical protein